MATLAELISALVSEFTAARVHADLEAVRVTEVYRRTPLLEGAPIPRFRLPELTIELPIGIEEIRGGLDALSDRYTPPQYALIREGVRDALSATTFSVTDDQQEGIAKELQRALEARWGEPPDLSSALSAVTHAVTAATDIVRTSKFDVTAPEEAKPDNEEFAERLRLRGAMQFQRSLQARLHEALSAQLRNGPRVQIIAETSQLREVKDSALITRLNVTLREDGFELVKIDRSDGSSVERLVPE